MSTSQMLLVLIKAKLKFRNLLIFWKTLKNIKNLEQEFPKEFYFQVHQVQEKPCSPKLVQEKLESPLSLLQDQILSKFS